MRLSPAISAWLVLVVGCQGDPVAAPPVDAGDTGTLDTGVALETGADGAVDAPLDTPTDAPTDAPGTIYPVVSDKECGSHKGGPMVFVAAGAFCIDAYEVTTADYQAFLAASDKEAGKPAYCSWNTTYKPTTPSFGADTPATGMNWCAAQQYCLWAGKHLCGKVSDGTPITPEDASHSQWTYACTNGGTSEWSASPAQCVTASSGKAQPQSVFANKDCHGVGAPYDRVFGLTGNVREWDGAGCETLVAGALPAGTRCGTRGGSHVTSDADAKCVTARDAEIDATAADFGLRCCKQP